MQIGITERGDAAIHDEWMSWVEKGKPAILITKDPINLYTSLHSFAHTPNVIVHCTITGYGRTKVEPNVPSPHSSIRGMKWVADLVGWERIVLRVDPIIPTKKGVERAKKVLEQTEHLNGLIPGRVRISFLDNYPHVKERFKKAGLPILPYNFYAPLEDRRRIVRNLNKQLGRDVEICGEPGLTCTGCVSAKELRVFGLTPSSVLANQRKACRCLSLKKELLNHRGQCEHGCLYCYWK